ncbi:MAG: NEPxGxxU motif selenoprotein TsoC [Thermodesulfobacteriota bacterium]
MQKVRFFLNEPNGRSCRHFKQMLPRLSEKFDIPFEVSERPRHEYQSLAYADLGLPRAPAIMIGGDVIVEGRDIDEQELEKILRQRLAQK